MSLKNSWRKGSYAKRGVFVGLSIGIIILVLLIFLWGLQPLYFYGQEKCTNFHSGLWKCDFGYLSIYIFLSIVAGAIVTIISTILCLFIGWSLGNKKVLKGEGIGLTIAIIIETVIVFLSFILPQSSLRTFLFGNYIGFRINYFFESFLVLFIVGLGLGAIIGYMRSRTA